VLANFPRIFYPSPLGFQTILLRKFTSTAVAILKSIKQTTQPQYKRKTKHKLVAKNAFASRYSSYWLVRTYENINFEF